MGAFQANEERRGTHRWRCSGDAAYSDTHGSTPSDSLLPPSRVDRWGRCLLPLSPTLIMKHQNIAYDFEDKQRQKASHSSFSSSESEARADSVSAVLVVSSPCRSCSGSADSVDFLMLLRLRFVTSLSRRLVRRVWKFLNNVSTWSKW